MLLFGRGIDLVRRKGKRGKDLVSARPPPPRWLAFSLPDAMSCTPTSCCCYLLAAISRRSAVLSISDMSPILAAGRLELERLV
jgi:hypothetical protein